jgi:hypothetical protein
MEIFDCRFPSPPAGGGEAFVGDDDVVMPQPPIGGIDLPAVVLDGEGAVSSGDVNGDGVVDLSDAARILNDLFIGGDAPARVLVTGFGDVDLEPQRSPGAAADRGQGLSDPLRAALREGPNADRPRLSPSIAAGASGPSAFSAAIVR